MLVVKTTNRKSVIIVVGGLGSLFYYTMCIYILCRRGGFLAFLWSKNGAVVVKGFGSRREEKVETAGSKITGTCIIVKLKRVVKNRRVRYVGSKIN